MCSDLPKVKNSKKKNAGGEEKVKASPSTRRKNRVFLKFDWSDMLEWQVSTPSNTFPVFYKFRSAMVHQSHFLKKILYFSGRGQFSSSPKAVIVSPPPPPPRPSKLTAPRWQMVVLRTALNPVPSRPLPWLNANVPVFWSNKRLTILPDPWKKTRSWDKIPAPATLK